MRKLIVLVAFLMSGILFAQVNVVESLVIPLQIFDEDAPGNNGTKEPTHLYFITQDDNVLTFMPFSDNLSLQLINDAEMVVYSISVPQGTTQVVLPVTISGNYEIRLVGSTYYYYGFISL